jgi:hypothetical protein
VNRRLLGIGVGLLLSLVISVAAWIFFDSVLLFLFLPVLPFLFGRGGAETEREIRVCPTCGFRTRDPDVAYCPRDGTELESEEGS